jgi:hypothetical protein
VPYGGDYAALDHFVTDWKCHTLWAAVAILATMALILLVGVGAGFVDNHIGPRDSFITGRKYGCATAEGVVLRKEIDRAGSVPGFLSRNAVSRTYHREQIDSRFPVRFHLGINVGFGERNLTVSCSNSIGKQNISLIIAKELIFFSGFTELFEVGLLAARVAANVGNYHRRDIERGNGANVLDCHLDAECSAIISENEIRSDFRQPNWSYPRALDNSVSPNCLFEILVCSSIIPACLL